MRLEGRRNAANLSGGKGCRNGVPGLDGPVDGFPREAEGGLEVFGAGRRYRSVVKLPAELRLVGPCGAEGVEKTLCATKFGIEHGMFLSFCPGRSRRRRDGLRLDELFLEVIIRVPGPPVAGQAPRVDLAGSRGRVPVFPIPAVKPCPVRVAFGPVPGRAGGLNACMPRDPAQVVDFRPLVAFAHDNS